MTHILTNATNNSVILSLDNTNTLTSNTIMLDVGESVLYETLNIDPLLLQEYIDSGILIAEDLILKPNSELQVIPQPDFTLNVSTGTPELIIKANNTGLDNLAVLPVVDKNGKILCIYYKSIQGMSISFDLGATQALINNDNLLFPDEITSFAVETYTSNEGVLQPIKRLFIGTLREGVKTFTPGVDTTYADFDPNVYFPGTSSEDKNPIFKNCVKHLETITKTYYSDPIYPDGTIISNTKPPDITFPSYCASYILAVVNNPINTGCPILIATRPKYTETATDIQYTYTNSVITNTIGPIYTTPYNNVYKNKIICKYLHDSIYTNNILTPTIPVINEPSYFHKGSNTWLLLKELGSSIESIINIINAVGLPDDILDVITEYTPDGALFITRRQLGRNNLLKFTCSANQVNIPILQDITITELDSAKINNISYLTETTLIDYDIFFTLPTAIWKYSSKTNTFSEFIGKDNPISYFNTRIDSGIFKTTGTTWLKELTSFTLVPKATTSNKYIGLLGTELGIIFYDLTLNADNTFTTDYKNGRILLNNVANSITTDIKISGQYAFICSYSNRIPRTYSKNKNYFHLVGNKTGLTKSTIYLKPDVETLTDSAYYVSPDIENLNHVYTSEQKSIEPLLIDTNYVYNLISPIYTFKASNFIVDTVLQTALTTFLASKYYYPVITERLLSSVNKVDKNTLQLNEFTHRFTMPYLATINISTPVGTSYTVSKKTSTVLPIYTNNGHTRNSIVCIRNDGSVVIPALITQNLINIDPLGNYLNDQHETQLIFTDPFSGTVFVGPVNNLVEHPILMSGLFATLPHGLNKYPQVVLDSSVRDKIVDISYIDANRIEVSFSSSVNTTLYFI